MRTMSYKRRRALIVPIILAAIALFSAITMLLWNALMPHIFHLTVINFWQAAGLLILGRLLFGGGHGHHHEHWHGLRWRRSIREKVAGMTPEEKKDFFRKFHEYRHFKHDDFWGKEAKKEGDKNE